MIEEGFVAIARTKEVPAGTVKVVTHAGGRYAVCHAAGEFFVVDDTCTHDDGPLGEGSLDGHAIVCPRHGARFDIRTGRVLQMPAAFPIRAYETRVEDDTVYFKASVGAPPGRR
jgi:3-phenylpropionate/trans-cinnamate dioxygenase ferredoxin subunit